MVGKKKKKFGQTTVGKILKASVGLINPTLGNIINGEMGIEDVISSIKNADAPPEVIGSSLSAWADTSLKVVVPSCGTTGKATSMRSPDPLTRTGPGAE